MTSLTTAILVIVDILLILALLARLRLAGSTNRLIRSLRELIDAKDRLIESLERDAAAQKALADARGELLNAMMRRQPANIVPLELVKK